ncbi:MAG: hypothetical protein IJY04_01545 [Clostridia bacterium]|nr:hypothetical protein [Clostridia bacterium]
MKKKLIAILMASLCVFLPILTSCAENPNEGGGDTDIIGGVIGDPNLTEMNWDGETFLVLTGVDRSEGQAFNIVDLVASEDDNLSNPIKKSVFERNSIIKQNFNAVIARQPEQDFQTIANDTLAHGEEYGAYMLKVAGALTLSLTGVLLDMNSEVNYINLNEEWWDTTTIDSLAIKNKAFFALGDINTVDDDATWCVLFNKALREQYPSLPNFYDEVKDGNWTIEKLKYWASKSIIEDNASGQKWDPNHDYQYGLFYQDECATVLLQASGVTPFRKEKSGKLTPQLGSVELQTAIDNIREYFMLENADSERWALNINNIQNQWGGTDVWQDVARGGFKANKALFFMCHCGSINLLRDMDNDFGILPIPKVTDTQEKYGNTVQYGNATCYTVPFNTPDSDFSGFMLEAMGYYSSRTFSTTDSLKVAYYETTLQRKGARDDESWDMLDMVFENRIFDISCAMNTKGINTLVVTSTISNDNAWATVVAENEEAIRTQIDEDIAHLMKG